MFRLLLILLVGLLFSQGTTQAGAQRGEALKLVSLTYPPYIYQEGEQIKGVAVDLVREVARRNDLKIDIQILPWPRSLSAVKMGTADGIFTIFKTQERLRFLDYVDEVLITQKVSLYMRNEGPSLMRDEVTQIKGLHVGLRRAVNYGQWFSQAIENNTWDNISYANGDEALLHKLVSNRVDLVPMNSNVAHFHMKRLGYTGYIREVSPPIEQVDSFIAFSKKTNTTRSRQIFSSSLREMRRDGSYHKIVARWFVDY